MPPKPANLDGVTPAPSVPLSPASGQAIKKELRNNPPAAQVTNPAKQTKNQVKATKTSHTPVITILITLIMMVLLVGLAYLAYKKSK